MNLEFIQELWDTDRNKVLDRLFPESKTEATGSGIKKGKGLSMKALENRINDLMSAIQAGNHSIETRNELDSLLSMMINKRKMKSKDRDTIMHQLYGQNKNTS